MSIDSSFKLIDYINRVSKVPLIVDGKPYGHPAPESVSIKASFFMKDDCTMCGRCCVNETMSYTSEGMQRILQANKKDFDQLGLNYTVASQLVNKLKKVEHDINGNLVEFWVSPKDSRREAQKLYWPDRGEKARCHWLIQSEGFHKCGIHHIRPTTCAIPHMRFMYCTRSKNTCVGTYQYGRNHKLGCPVKFSGYDESSVQGKLRWLHRLNHIAEDMKVDTFFPEIIKYLEDGNRTPTVFYPHAKKKLFSIGGIDSGVDK